MTGSTCQSRKFEKLLERIRERNEQAWVWIDSLEKEKWAMAHDGGCRYGHTNTNVAECVNSVLKDARRLPVVALVQYTFYNMVRYFNNRRNMYASQLASGKVFTSHCMALIEHRMKSAYRHHVTSFSRAQGIFEVKTGYCRETRKGGNTQVLCLADRHCSCGKFEAAKIPCSHALAACMAAGIDYSSYIDPVYTLQTVLKCYRSEFQPLGDETLWPTLPGDDGRVLIPDPDTKRKKGKPAGRRRNEMDASSSSRVRQHCRRCGRAGHNRKTCSEA